MQICWWEILLRSMELAIPFCKQLHPCGCIRRTLFMCSGCWVLHLCHNERHKKMKSDGNKMNMQKKEDSDSKESKLGKDIQPGVRSCTFGMLEPLCVAWWAHIPQTSPNTADMLSPTYKEMNASVWNPNIPSLNTLFCKGYNFHVEKLGVRLNHSTDCGWVWPSSYKQQWIW